MNNDEINDGKCPSIDELSCIKHRTLKRIEYFATGQDCCDFVEVFLLLNDISRIILSYLDDTKLCEVHRILDLLPEKPCE